MSWTCPSCGFLVDTPNHNLGCPVGRAEAAQDALASQPVVERQEGSRPFQQARVIKALREAWAASPHLRLCQLIVNVTGRDDPFYVEDSALEAALGAPSQPETHVDRISLNPLSAESGRLLARYRSIDDPRIGGQERQGWATYVYISEPHTMAECPFGPGDVLEPQGGAPSQETGELAVIDADKLEEARRDPRVRELVEAAGSYWDRAKPEETGEPKATVPVMALRPDEPDSDEMDDIVVKDVKMFRAEAMSEYSWWLACYFANGEQVSFNVSAHCRPRRLSVTVGDMPGEWEDFDARSALSPNQPEGE